ncbi:uncharacterized protein LOC127836354 isoform X2 [Dreissena polymorpha]|uniref:THD domain-containing protein n=1 Tax=Dreissena polymorpha TaxID=45954 RepID=A0A9D4GCW0_DREPO|nr:uncharacterized protein LOC127836354 isoform X2 [Dreissena polymorpha]XP_052218905.1 uncharacterized protein LOC127836354 isoform X2 [Dreissena polymorpha]KAH3814557.1 hypothetical protein DPMN_143059 [Dreissena polymorpha]
MHVITKSFYLKCKPFSILIIFLPNFQELADVYAKTLKQDNIDTKKYFDDHVKIELKNDYLASIPDMKPAAKLVGLITYKQTGSVTMNYTPNKMETVVAWFNGRDLDYTTGFMRYGMRYQNGRLIVPLTGTYNIYSFLSLTENNDTPEDRAQHANATLVKHAMYKYNVKLGEDVEIASSIQTHRQSANRNFNAFSSHISTLVQLEAGDEISVKISDISLTTYPGDNFFGIHMV